MVKRKFLSAARKYYEPGDKITLLEPTGQDPFNTGDPYGHWIVKCPHFSPPDPQSIWSDALGLAFGVRHGFLEVQGAKG